MLDINYNKSIFRNIIINKIVLIFAILLTIIIALVMCYFIIITGNIVAGIYMIFAIVSLFLFLKAVYIKCTKKIKIII